MTAENNRKYIAEAWIDDGTEEEMKKSFLKSLIEQMQGHLNGFDSDTVDGMHWEEVDGDDGIKDYIDKKVVSLLSSFKIGITLFSGDKEDGQYYLGFDAIKLFDFDYYDKYDESDKKLPWTNVISEESEIPTLLDVINELYTRTCITKEYQESNREGYDEIEIPIGSTNNSLYNDFIKRLINLEKGFGDKIQPIEQNGQVIRLLDADTINGLRFYIYNEEEYAALEALASQYIEIENDNTEDPQSEDEPTNDPQSEDEPINDPEVEEAYSFLTSIHNVFIIKKKEDLIAAGYKDGVYDNNPDVITFKHGYEFRIITVDYIDETTGETKQKKVLQYKYKMGTEWKDVSDAQDFIDENRVSELVIDTINNNTTYKLNETALAESLKPFINQNKANYIVGGVYNYHSMASKNDVEVIQIPENTGYKYLNLTPFQNEIETHFQNDLNDYKVRLEGQDQKGGLLGQMGNNINSNTSNISTLTNRINDLERQLSTVNNQLQKAEFYLEKVYNWKQVCYWNGIGQPGHSTAYEGYANKDFVTFKIWGTFNNVPTTWTDYGGHAIIENSYFWPSLPHSFIDYEMKVVFRVRDNTGRLEYRSNTGSFIKSTNVYVNTVWKARGGTYDRRLIEWEKPVPTFPNQL